MVWWTILSPKIERRVVRWKLTDVSEEYTASIFGAEEYSKQETSMKQGAISAPHLFLAGFLFGLFLDPVEGDDIFLRNVC
jgi:hypothetical protein